MGRARQGGLCSRTKKERLAKFPLNEVETSPWHGFPVSPMGGRASECPEDELIDELIERGAITRTFGRKIQRRRA